MSANLPFCERESAVIEAVRRGQCDDDLRVHVAACPACSDAALAARALREMHAADLAQAQVPSAGWMWWRMQLRAKREAADRATQPITLIEQVTYVCIALSAIGLFVWNWRAISAWFGSLGAASRLSSFSIHGFLASQWENAGVLTLVCAAGSVLIFGLVAYLIWVEE